MDIDNVLNELQKYCETANLNNIEEIMQDVDGLLTAIPEQTFYSVADEINRYMNILNPLYIEKMKLLGKVVSFSIEDLLKFSSN